MARQPELVAAGFSALTSTDPDAVSCQQQVAALIDGIIASAIGDPELPDQVERTRVIGHVWHSLLVGWSSGRSDLTRIREELIVALDLLLPGDLGATSSG
jgi:hypothetical protein